MNEQERLFSDGKANPDRFGWPLRSSAGSPQDPNRVDQAARLLGRSAFFVDGDGYECEIIGAAIGACREIAFVESRAREEPSSDLVDISIRIHLVEPNGSHRSADIESYNPFFGCDVRYFEWIGRAAVLIYREKHSTFVCRFGDVWPPRFVKIEHDWIISGGMIGFIGYQEKRVRRVSIPALEPCDPLSVEEAARIGLLPAKS